MGSGSFSPSAFTKQALSMQITLLPPSCVMPCSCPEDLEMKRPIFQGLRSLVVHLISKAGAMSMSAGREVFSPK